MTEDKFLALVHEHKAQIYQHAFYLLRNREDAEDITQETFIRAWEHRRKLRLKTVRSWLLKCAQNLCFNLLKRQKFQEPLTEGDERELETLLHRHTHQSNPSPDEIVIKQELKASVHCAIKKLPTRNAFSDNHAGIGRHEFQRDCRSIRATRRHCKINSIPCP